MNLIFTLLINTFLKYFNKFIEKSYSYKFRKRLIIIIKTEQNFILGKKGHNWQVHGKLFYKKTKL